jgi:hypothetical protein
MVITRCLLPGYCSRNLSIKLPYRQVSPNMSYTTPASDKASSSHPYGHSDTYVYCITVTSESFEVVDINLTYPYPEASPSRDNERSAPRTRVGCGSSCFSQLRAELLEISLGSQATLCFEPSKRLSVTLARTYRSNRRP